MIVKLSRLTIPGTHDSCARTITDWPVNGYVKLPEFGREFYLGLVFGSVVRDVFVNFLKQNPKECILMQIKKEYGDANNLARN